MSELTSTAIKKLKVVDLKAELSKRGLSTKGKKDDLASRLLESVAGIADDHDEGVAFSVKESDEAGSEQQSQDTEDETVDKSEPKPPTTDSIEEEDVASSQLQLDGLQGDVDEVMDEKQLLTNSTEEEMCSSKEVEMQDSSNVADKDTSTCNNESSPKKEIEHLKETSEKDEDLNSEVIADTEEISTKQSDVNEEKSITNANSTISTEDEVLKKEDKKKADLEKKQAGEISFIGEPEVKLEEEDYEKEYYEDQNEREDVVLDSCSADLHFVCKPDGLTGRNLVKNDLAFVWCGVKSNHGVTSGKVCYECKILQKLEVDLPDSEDPKHAVRIGWSAESSGLQLGEASLSYGYESSGKICASSNFSNYADPFGEGDIIGAFLDLESEPKTLRYTKNGLDLGIAMSLSVNLEGKALFPHIFIKNMEIEMNFGSRESPWHETLEGYAFVQQCSPENLQKRTEALGSKSECEVIMMVGLPASGKTTWSQIHCRDNKEKCHYTIGKRLVFDRMKLQGQVRKKESDSYQRLIEASQRIIAKFLALAPSKKRNYILDQTNVNEMVRKTKMENFSEFKRKAVVIIPTYENFRRQVNEQKQREGNEVPFEVLASMKYYFSLPTEGEIFESVEFAEEDLAKSQKAVDGYHREGKRALERGSEDQQHKRQRHDQDRRGPRQNSSHNDGRRYDDRRRNRRRDNRRGADDYSGKSYNTGSYGAGSYGVNSYSMGYGSQSGGYGNSSYGQRNAGYGGSSYGSYGGQRGMYGGGSYSGNYSQQSASGYRQSSDRGRYRQSGGGGQSSQNYSNRSRGSQSGSYSGGRGVPPRGGGWSQGYGNQQGYNSYHSGQNNFRGYGY